MRLHVVGPAGVGKSAVAWQTAEALRLPLISLGGVLRAVAGAGPAAWDGELRVTPAVPHQRQRQRVHLGDRELLLDETDLVAEAAAAQLGRASSAAGLFARISAGLAGDAVCEGRPCVALMRPGDHVVRLTAAPAERARRLRDETHRAFAGPAGDWLAGRDARDAGLDAVPYDELRVHYHHLQTDGWDRTRTVAAVVDLALRGRSARPPSVSVVIPARNSAPTVVPLVRELLSQGEAAPQIIVADDGSADGTAGRLRQLPVTLVATRPNRTGRAAARNAGLARATGDIVVFLDADVLPRAGFLSRVIRAHDRYPGALVIGPRDHVADLGDLPVHPARLDSREALLDRYGYDLRRLRHPWLLAYTCNLSMPAAAARELRFDEELRGWGLEDVELALRATRSGGCGITVFDPGRRVWHRQPAGSAPAARQRYEEWSANARQLGRRHGAAVAGVLDHLAAVHDPARRADYLDTCRAIEGPPPATRDRFLPRSRLADAALVNEDSPEPVFPEPVPA